MANGSFNYSKIHRLCPIIANKRKFYANLLLINTHGFIVILGIDWLSNFHVVIDCQKTSIVLEGPNHPKFEFVEGSSQVG